MFSCNRTPRGLLASIDPVCANFFVKFLITVTDFTLARKYLGIRLMNNKVKFPNGVMYNKMLRRMEFDVSYPALKDQFRI